MSQKQNAFISKHHPRVHRQSTISNGRLMIQKGREFAKKADDIHRAMQSENDDNMMQKYRFYHQRGTAMMQHGHHLLSRAQQGGLNPHRMNKWVHILMEMRQWEVRFLTLKRRIINKIRGNF